MWCVKASHNIYVATLVQCGISQKLQYLVPKNATSSLPILHEIDDFGGDILSRSSYFREHL